MNKFLYNSDFPLEDYRLLSKKYNKSTSWNFINIVNVNFKSNVSWWTWNYNYTFEDCDFEWNIIIVNWNLTFKKCNFKESINNIRFWRRWSIFFEDCKFEIDFKIEEVSTFSVIIFKNCSINNISLSNISFWSLYFIDTNFKKLNINNVSIIDKWKQILNWQVLPLYISIKSNKKLWNIEIDWVKGLENLHIWDTRNKWNFWNIKIRNLNFLSWDNHSYIINDSKIKKLDISYCSNFSNKLVFQNLELSDLSIKNTDLWKTTFNWVDIKKLYLENVTLNDCIFNWVEFPINYELEKWNLSNKKLRDIYRQLKHIMDKNSNHIEANKFFENEMFYYMEYLKDKKILEKWWWKKLKENFFTWDIAKLISEKISLRLWYSISEFWNNWILPIFLIFLLSLLVVDVFYLLDNYKPFVNYHINIINNIIEDFSISKMIAQVLLYFLAIFLVVKFYKFIFKYFPVVFIVWYAVSLQFNWYPIITNFIEFLYPFHWLFNY